MKVGILAFQGAVHLQKKKLSSLGVEPFEVRYEQDFDSLSGIVLPGGESTTMIHLLKLHNLWDPLARFCKERPVWGICAGAILLSKKVTGPEQESLGLIDVHAERNSYGTQLDSFIDRVEPKSFDGESVEGVFIRAPRLLPLSEKVKTLFTHGDDAVCLEQDQILVSSFHPELSDDKVLHHYFLEKCREANHG